MSNYTKTTNFSTKDALPSGNPAKIVKGTEIDTEFNNIATAVATKSNSASPTFTGTLTAPVVTASTSLNIAGDGATVTGIKDEDDMASNSATKLATQQSIKAYVDSQVTAQDLDVTDGTTSISIDLDSEALSLLGGTGIDSTASGNSVTMAIDSTVATLTGTQTLTNKTLTSPDVNTPDIDGGTIDGTVIGGTTAAAGSFTTVGATGNITVGGTVDGRDVATDGTKLDGIEAGATADQTAAEIKTAYESNANTNAFTDADESKLDGIEAGADVTDTANVTAAGALMDSELTSIASVKALDQGVATTDSPTFAAATVTGEITANGGIALGDSDKATFGAGDDLQLYHDGSNSYIQDAGTGSLNIKSNGSFIDIQSDSTRINNAANNEIMATFVANGAVSLYHDNASKLATTSTGIDVTGTATMDGLTVTGSNGNFEVATTGNSVNMTRAGNNFITASDSSGDLYLGAGGTSFIKIDNGGDISFYEDTGTTPKFFWDASAESLGIGTSSPASVLDVSGEAPTLTLRDSRTGGSWTAGTALGKLDFYTSDSTGIGAHSIASIGVVAGGANEASPDGELVFATGPYNIGSTERMRIDSSGNVGIGTSLPLQALHVNSGTGNSAAIFESTDSTSQIWLKDSASSTTYQTGLGCLGDNLLFNNGGERMRIDSSGGLLVGKTAADDFSSAGAQIEATGQITNSVASAPSLRLNRGGNDGDIIEFNKSGVPVGSIGNNLTLLQMSSASAGGVFLADNGTNIFGFANGENAFRPASDAVINLGKTDRRFKDLYLSGGVYLGGTGAANKLDDYEEGTWTPTVIGTTSGSATVTTITSATYTKVGNLVTATCYITTDLSAHNIVGNVVVGGLPFAGVSHVQVTSNNYINWFTTDESSISVGGRVVASAINLTKGSSTSAYVASDLIVGSAAIGMFGVTYTAS